ncbi:hypothetical protein I79_002683 [Cricetulus griseus]|uniref:Uncharacterized protein n=1 Tax=Cricetulus griseus TaxID=10029 RepID=G3GY29_CRIGR|nr:hypothetical protein I79_002683 [Cricetulus griseus]
MWHNQNGTQIWDGEHRLVFRERKGFWAAPLLQYCVEDGPGKEIPMSKRRWRWVSGEGESLVWRGQDASTQQLSVTHWLDTQNEESVNGDSRSRTSLRVVSQLSIG